VHTHTKLIFPCQLCPENHMYSGCYKLYKVSCVQVFKVSDVSGRV